MHLTVHTFLSAFFSSLVFPWVPARFRLHLKDEVGEKQQGSASVFIRSTVFSVDLAWFPDLLSCLHVVLYVLALCGLISQTRILTCALDLGLPELPIILHLSLSRDLCQRKLRNRFS